MTPEVQDAVNNLVAMTGRGPEECVQALTIARGSPDVAYDILISGVPLNQLPADMGEGDDDDMEDEGSDVGAGGAGANPFLALASNPNFALIRERIL